jgi:hypothetical protein
VRPALATAAALGSVVCVCYNGSVTNANLTRRAALAGIGGGALLALSACFFGDDDDDDGGGSSSSRKKSKSKKKK